MRPGIKRPQRPRKPRRSRKLFDRHKGTVEPREIPGDLAPMLIGLAIRDVVLIESLDLSIGPGLTALTGETGAGKSIILDALGLATGARAEAGLVRRGTAQAQATAIFAPPRDH